MGFELDHLKAKADLWLFTEQRDDTRKAKCCVCNKTKAGEFTSVNVVVLGCNKFLAGKMCEACFPNMKAAWEQFGILLNDEQQPVDAESTGQKEPTT